MPNVPAHTSSVGYYTQHAYIRYDYGPSNRPFGQLSDSWASRSVLVAVSNRSPVVKSDGKSATTYFRKVGRLDSLAAPRVTTDTHKYEANSSIGYRGVTLYMNPLGSSYASPSTTVPQWMTDKVIQDATAELNNVRVYILEDLFEAQKTLDTAIGIFNLIVKLYLIARKRDWRRLRRLLRSLGHDPGRKAANGWLMYYYGIRPLISTMGAALDAYRAKEKTMSSTKKVEEAVDVLNFVDWSYSNVVNSGKAKQMAKCGLTVDISMSSTVNAWSSFGFTGNANDDAATVLWAITPYSFVVDWLLPVQRFLSTRRWTSGVKHKYGYITKLIHCDGIVTETNPMTGSNDRGSLPVVRVRCLQFSRTAYNNYIPPSGLTLDWSLNSTQLFNATALLIQKR